MEQYRFKQLDDISSASVLRPIVNLMVQKHIIKDEPIFTEELFKDISVLISNSAPALATANEIRYGVDVSEFDVTELNVLKSIYKKYNMPDLTNSDEIMAIVEKYIEQYTSCTMKITDEITGYSEIVKLIDNKKSINPEDIMLLSTLIEKI